MELVYGTLPTMTPGGLLMRAKKPGTCYRCAVPIVEGNVIKWSNPVFSPRLGHMTKSETRHDVCPEVVA